MKTSVPLSVCLYILVRCPTSFDIPEIGDFIVQMAVCSVGNNKITAILVYNCYLNCRVKQISYFQFSLLKENCTTNHLQLVYLKVFKQQLLTSTLTVANCCVSVHSALLKSTHPYFPEPVPVKSDYEHNYSKHARNQLIHIHQYVNQFHSKKTGPQPHFQALLIAERA